MLIARQSADVRHNSSNPYGFFTASNPKGFSFIRSFKTSIHCMKPHNRKMKEIKWKNLRLYAPNNFTNCKAHVCLTWNPTPACCNAQALTSGDWLAVWPSGIVLMIQTLGSQSPLGVGLWNETNKRWAWEQELCVLFFALANGTIFFHLTTLQ